MLDGPEGQTITAGSTVEVEGEYPSLAYNLVTVSGVDNPLPAPIYMVKLNTDNAVWAGPEDTVLTLPDVPGFKLEIPAHSVTFPDGSREGYVSVTVVNTNTIPMTPPNGMQPQFIVTIQPTNALFDPPARLTLPNVDGHLPGRQVEMFSFDHDLEEFVAIGLGTVSEDATEIRSNPYYDLPDYAGEYDLAVSVSLTDGSVVQLPEIIFMNRSRLQLEALAPSLSLNPDAQLVGQTPAHMENHWGVPALGSAVSTIASGQG